jgi:hypothetical protein
MTDSLDPHGSRPGRRRFLGLSVAGIAGSFAACDWFRSAGGDVDRGRTAFSVMVEVEGGLYRLDQRTRSVEVAYPRQMNDDAACAFATHPMQLRVKAGIVEADQLPATGPWDLADMTLRFAVSGSSTRPDPGRWREKPARPHPEEGSPESEGDLDWIPTIKGNARDWDTRAATRLVFPSGEWLAESPKQPEVRNELWSLKVDNTERRKQYVTDMTSWADSSDGAPVVVTFEKAGTKVGTLKFTPRAGRPVDLKIGATRSGPLVKVGDPVEHYCLYYSLLSDVEDKLIPYRTGETFRTLMADGQPVPGRFCPGGKIIA